MRSTARVALHVFGALFGALAVVFGLGAWRLTEGPLSLGFLSPYVEEALHGEDLSYRFEFEDTLLVWAGWGHPLEIQLTDLRIADTEGETLAQVPAAAIGLSGAALLRGVVAPTSIELREPRLGLVRSLDGQLHLAGSGDGRVEAGAADAAGATDSSDAADDLVADLLDPPREDHPMARLRRVALSDAAVDLHDEASGLTWTSPTTDLTLDLDEASIVGHLSTDLHVQDAEAHLEVQLFHHRETGMGSAAVTFAGLEPSQLAAIAPEFGDLGGWRLPLSGTVTVDLAPGSAFGGAVFDITGGPGEVALPAVFPAPVPVRRLAASGSVDDTLTRLVLDSFTVGTDRPSVSLEGEIWEADAGIGVRGSVRVRDMPFDSLGDYWPEDFLEEDRSWIVDSIKGGTITAFDAALDIAPGALEEGGAGAASAAGTLAFENAGIRYAGTAPAAEGGDSIQLPLTGTVTFDLAPEKGAGGAFFDITGGPGEVVLPAVFPAPVPIRTLAISGSVDETLSRLVLDSLTVDTDRPSVSLEGEIWEADAGIGMRGNVRIRDMPFDSLGDYWPEDFLGEGRDLIVDSIKGGTITSLDAALDVAPGALEEGAAGGASASGTLVFENAGIRYAGTTPAAEGSDSIRLPLSGTVTFDLAPESAPGGATFGVTGGPGEIILPDVFSAPVPIRRLAARGSVDDTLTRLEFDSLTVESDRPSFFLDGEIWQADAGIGVRGNFRMRDVPFESLGTYWPTAFLGPGRNWIVKNVEDGVISQFDAALDLPPGALEDGRFDADAASGMLAFENASMHYLRPLPPVEGVDGTGRFTGNSLALEMSGGRIGDVTASRGSALLSDFYSAEPRLSTMIEAEGPVDEALALLDHPRLALVTKTGLQPSGAGGRVQTLFTVSLPLIGSLTAEQVDVSAVARLQDARLDGIAGLVDLTEGALSLGVDNRSMDVRGTARLQGMPATISWQEGIGDDAPLARRFDVSTTVTPEGQAALGLDLAPHVQGSLAIEAQYDDPGGDEAPRAELHFDATEAQFSIPDLYWFKPAGEPGSVHVLAAFSPDGSVELTRVEVDTETLSAVGQATLAPGLGTVRDITIESLRNGMNDIAGRIEIDDGITRVSIRGSSFDARPYLDSLMDESESRSGALAFDLDIERLVVDDDGQLTNVRARFESDSGGRHAGFMEGTLATGVPMHFSVEPHENKRRVTVRSSDAGAVAHAFDIYDNAVGGELLLEAVLHDDRPGVPITGTVRIDDYRVINAPTLAQLLSIATLFGLVDILRGDGIAFSELEMPFSIEDDVLTIREARTSGFVVGVNAEGTVDLETERVNMRGTIVPAHTLNTLVEVVPVIGELLTGGKGEGLFAAAYQVSGTTEEPEIQVNPLTVLTPGFLRNLFSFLGGRSDEEE